MTWVDVAAVLAALLQVSGYALYIWHALRDETRPNAASSLMFAYGTGLLVFLEYEAGGSWRVLLLPGVCGVLGIVVAVLCFRTRGRIPIARIEIAAFALDLALTVLYVALFTIGRADASPERREVLAFWFLVASNTTTLTSFAPLVLSTHGDPEREQPGPWIIWSAAYGMLALVAVADGGLTAPILLVYPAVNLVLHGAIAVLSTRAPRPRSAWMAS